MRILLAFVVLGVFAISCAPEESDGTSSGNNPAPNRNVDTIGLYDGSRMEEVNDLIGQDPDNPNHYHTRSYLHYYNGDIDLAINDVKKAIEIDEQAPFYYSKGVFFHSQLKLSEARTAFEQAVDMDPEIPGARNFLAKIALVNNNYDKAMRYVNDELKMDVHNAEGYFLKGVIYEELRDTANAMSSFLTATEQNSRYYEAYIRLGVLTAAKKDPLSLEYYRNALDIKTNSTEALYNRARFYQDTRQYDLAVMDYQRIIQTNPSYALSYYNLGYMYAEYDTLYNKAIGYYHVALANDPGNFLPQTYYNLGVAHFRNNAEDSAVYYFRKAIDADDDYQDPIDALNQLGY